MKTPSPGYRNNRDDLSTKELSLVNHPLFPISHSRLDVFVAIQFENTVSSSLLRLRQTTERFRFQSSGTEAKSNLCQADCGFHHQREIENQRLLAVTHTTSSTLYSVDSPYPRKKHSHIQVGVTAITVSRASPTIGTWRLYPASSTSIEITYQVICLQCSHCKAISLFKFFDQRLFSNCCTCRSSRSD